MQSVSRVAPILGSLLLPALLLAAHQEPSEGDSPTQDAPAAGAPHTEGRYPAAPDGSPPPFDVEGAEAESPADMGSYIELIQGSKAKVPMTPIPGGSFLYGSPEAEPDRKPQEGPQVEVEISPFWIGTYELGWDAYSVFQHNLDVQLRERGDQPATPQDAWADSVSRPTPPYVPMDFGWGKDGMPAICMTQFAAKQFTKWLSMKTGRFYRLPTEAEWEYACRAGTKGSYSFEGGEDALDDHAWWFDNADDRYQALGSKKPNPWGLYDMHGNVAEWCLDGYEGEWRKGLPAGVKDPIHWPTELYPRVTRGGSWDDDPDALRSAARKPSKPGWKVQDPQLPKSIWYHTDARFVGFRVVRPLVPPPPSEQARYWEADLDEVLRIQQRQRRGER